MTSTNDLPNYDDLFLLEVRSAWHTFTPWQRLEFVIFFRWILAKRKIIIWLTEVLEVTEEHTTALSIAHYSLWTAGNEKGSTTILYPVYLRIWGWFTDWVYKRIE